MKYLTADFGSTYTKVTAIDIDQRKIMGTGAAYTTIEDDVRKGLDNAMEELYAKIGHQTFDKMLCCSSAAGGLKMIASGLVPDLTAKAARMAAASAGAKVVKTYAYDISKKECAEIEAEDPDLILICGGTDGGNTATIIHNTRSISQIPGHFAIIVAGNKSAESEIKEILDASGKRFIITDNVMPDFNTLNTTPAKECIMQLFIEQIIEAKGLMAIQERCDNQIIPTPLAVLNACNLLSHGTRQVKGLGELMAVDLGGATTDVYSMAKGLPTSADILMRGIPEPFNKRTVEGDLGMRYSLTFLSEEFDHYDLAEELGVEVAQIDDWIARCVATPALRAENKVEAMIELGLAREAVRLASTRHVGKLKKVYTPMGEVYTITGKDLMKVELILGIGGALVHADDPAFILKGAAFDVKEYEYAKPRAPRFMLDKAYIMASMGLLSEEDPDTALTIMKEMLTEI